MTLDTKVLLKDTNTVVENGIAYLLGIFQYGDQVNIYWYLNEKFHREKGPAVFGDSIKYAWYQNGLRHRLDGPAIIWDDGRIVWHINGNEFTENQHTKIRTMLALGLDKI
jgi:hypothetical protein